MPDLDDEEQQKLKGMLADWDNMRLAIRTLSYIGAAIGWCIGIASGALFLWDQFFHGKGH